MPFNNYFLLFIVLFSFFYPALRMFCGQKPLLSSSIVYFQIHFTDVWNEEYAMLKQNDCL